MKQSERQRIREKAVHRLIPRRRTHKHDETREQPQRPPQPLPAQNEGLERGFVIGPTDGGGDVEVSG